MRFPPLLTPSKIFPFTKKITDWPLSLRFAALVIPVGMGVAMLGLLMGYRAASTSLRDSMETLPTFEAKTQAKVMEDTLSEIRDSLFLLATLDNTNAQAIARSIALLFHNHEDLIREISFKGENGQDFIILRDKSGFHHVDSSEFLQNPHGPLQQLSDVTPAPGNTVLYPAVYISHPTTDVPEKITRLAILRMALTLPDNSGAIMVGINLGELCKRLGVYSHPNSPLRSPLQDGEVQLSYFFDANGWILFENGSFSHLSFLPDAARRGFTGDLGRPGFGSAFRPWAIHEEYWRMVTNVMEQRAGCSRKLGEHYTESYISTSGLLCYSPVTFATSPTSMPQPIGGIVFFETSSVPLKTFMRAANASLGVLFIAFVLCVLISLRVRSTLALPFRTLSMRMKAIAAKGEYSSMEDPPACEEHQRIQAVANALVSQVIVLRDKVNRLEMEAQSARASVPVDLSHSFAPPIQDVEFGLAGSSTVMQKVREQIQKAARAGTDVHVWGETGTGKELVAAAIHKASNRCEGPYISINCGALDENLLQDALFGHTKGAFTEAKSDRKGAFLAAEGGTLHLDEIANASNKVQQALLRALSVRRIRPLGGDHEIPFNTRVVSATNVDLRDCVRAGTFREDLYYRLAIISIQTPALRQRKEDLPELAAHCMHETAMATRHAPMRLSRGALEAMTAHDWPGNVRELKNCLARAMAFTDGDIILRHHIMLEQSVSLVTATEQSAGAEMSSPTGKAADASAKDAQAETEPSAIRKLTDKLGWSNPLTSGGRKQNGQSTFEPAAPFPAQLPSGSLPLQGSTPAQNNTLLPPLGISDQNAPSVPLPDAQPTPALQRPEQAFAASSTDNAPVPSSISSTHQGIDLYAADSANKQSTPLDFLDEALQASLNERQTQALVYIRLKGEMTRAQYETVVGQQVSSRTAQNDLRELVELGLLQRVGAGPGTRYEIVS